MKRTRAGAKATSLPVVKASGYRVYLRAPVADDGREYVAMHRASRVLFRRAASPTLSVAQFRKSLAQPGAATARFFVCLRDNGRIVGEVALSQIFLGRLRSAYLGYSIGAPYSGNGYMQEGVALALRYAFRTLRLNRVEANIQPWNARSIALVQRLGFTLEGYSRRYLKITSAWRDHQRWALLAADWKPARALARETHSSASAEFEIRDLGLHDIAAFAVLRHRLSLEGHFLLREPAETVVNKEKFAEQVAQTLTDPSRKRLVAFHGKRMVGYVSVARGNANRDRHAAQLGVAIAEAYTGRGLGNRFMAEIEAWAKNVGVRRLDLRVMVDNARAIALYMRCGYSIEGRLRGEFLVDGRLVDAYVMGKLLN